MPVTVRRGSCRSLADAGKTTASGGRHHSAMTDTVRGPADDGLLLFHKVEELDGRATGWRLLDDGMGGPAWRLGRDVDRWELRDVAAGDDDEPVAAAATCQLGDGRRVRLLAVVVAGAHRGHGIGRRTIEELADALRARGVLVLVTSVPVDDARAMVTVRRAGFRPSHVERHDGGAAALDQVWFDVAL